MTDNEIIKALEVCNCDTLELALDLINRQKAEIERLEEYEEIRPVGCPNCSRGNFSNSKFCSHCGVKLPAQERSGSNG